MVWLPADRLVVCVDFFISKSDRNVFEVMHQSSTDPAKSSFRYVRPCYMEAGGSVLWASAQADRASHPFLTGQFHPPVNPNPIALHQDTAFLPWAEAHHWQAHSLHNRDLPYGITMRVLLALGSG